MRGIFVVNGCGDIDTAQAVRRNGGRQRRSGE